jgi:hypothetical protein
MKLNPKQILERAGQIRIQLKKEPSIYSGEDWTPARPIESTQVRALCMAICEALNENETKTKSKKVKS